jgi:predicted TIM-barrel fold metal-dependent hydrolase
MKYFLAWAAAVPAVVLISCAPPAHTTARQQIDPQLAHEIDRIPAIDNHAHPVRVTNDGEKDSDFDALPVEMMEPYSTFPLRVRADNTEFTAAWVNLYGARHEDMQPEHVKQALDAKRRVMKQRGDGYPAWVLDRLGIGMMFANRVTMGRGLNPDRFKWVPFGDALMYPLNNESLGRRDPDRRAFFAAESALLKRYLSEAGMAPMPGTLDEYLRFVTATLERWKQQRAVAVKLEMAYLRSFDVGNPPRAEAERVYATYLQAGLPADSEYKALQDFLFRHLAKECGRLGMPVHLHSSVGAGRYYDVAGVNPMLLLPVITDGEMQKTDFVLVHGSWPYVREVTSMLDKPNLYVDMSLQTLVLYPRALSEVLRGWLEYEPEKVLFGTDAGPFSADLSWEETGYLSASTGRDALGLALTAMLRDREITRERAMELAHMVMRDNAARLYRLR